MAISVSWDLSIDSSSGLFAVRAASAEQQTNADELETPAPYNDYKHALIIMICNLLAAQIRRQGIAFHLDSQS